MDVVVVHSKVQIAEPSYSTKTLIGKKNVTSSMASYVGYVIFMYLLSISYAALSLVSFYAFLRYCSHIKRLREVGGIKLKQILLVN